MAGGFLLIPVSWGELLDKITILEIKRQRIAEPAARANVEKEHRLLCDAAGSVLDDDEVAALVDQLRSVNRSLWGIEDAIRAQEAAEDFGPRFTALARAVYTANDRRAALKRAINVMLNSAIVEEKSYGAHA